MKNKVRVSAPASSGNVGPGFDVFGLALQSPRDTVEVTRLAGEPAVKITSILGDEGRLPLDASKNTAGLAALEVLKQLQKRGDSFQIEMVLEKGMPLNSGLGSSGASAAAAARAVSLLSEVDLAEDVLLQCCAVAEEGVAGFHADNVAPSLMGGFVVIEQYNPLRYVRIEPRMEIPLTILKPMLEVSTKMARELVPELITISAHIHNLGRCTRMVSALYEGDLSAFGEAIRDVIVEPERASLVPGFDTLQRELIDAGALACTLSGSGPSILVIHRDLKDREQAVTIARDVFHRNCLEMTVYDTAVDLEGAKEIPCE